MRLDPLSEYTTTSERNYFSCRPHTPLCLGTIRANSYIVKGGKDLAGFIKEGRFVVYSSEKYSWVRKCSERSLPKVFSGFKPSHWLW